MYLDPQHCLPLQFLNQMLKITLLCREGPRAGNRNRPSPLHCFVPSQFCVSQILYFQGTVQWDFRPLVFFLHYSNLPGPLTNGFKYFRFWLRFCWVIRIVGSKNQTIWIHIYFCDTVPLKACANILRIGCWLPGVVYLREIFTKNLINSTKS